MLLRFGVENHLSIRERQELVLTAAKRVRRAGPTVPVPILKEEALPVAVIYGANAAGKSNLVHAIYWMLSHVRASHKRRYAGDSIPRHPFLLDDSSAGEPTRFDCMFTVHGRDASATQEVYEYGFSCTDTEFTDEWLHRIVRQRRQTTQLLFHRTTEDGNVQVSFGGRLRGENRAIATLTRPNSLFLAAAAQNNHPQLVAIHHQLAQRQVVQKDDLVEHRLAEAFARLDHKDAFTELMRQADLGIVGTELTEYETPEFTQVSRRAIADSTDESDLVQLGRRFRFAHAMVGGKRTLDYDLESNGTRVLSALAIRTLNAFPTGQPVLVDELDSCLHHRLTEALIGLFKGTTNRNGAQLIATVHDTALLRDLELDEVWLAEKDAYGASHFKPLTDFRIRSREDLEKVYREGRVGGAPVIGDLAVGLDA